MDKLICAKQKVKEKKQVKLTTTIASFPISSLKSENIGG